MAGGNLFAVVGKEIVQDRKCTACPLGLAKGLKSNCMKGSGPKNPLLMIVGVNPGNDDDTRGIPYSGPTGKLLWEILHEAGIKQSEVYVTNAVKCIGDAKKNHWLACQKHLKEEIKRVQPQAIVTVGGPAATWVTGHQLGKIRRRHTPCVLDPSVPVYPMPQPAQLFHVEGAARKRMWEQMVGDWEWIKQDVENGSQKKLVTLDYRLARTVNEVDRFLAEFDDVDEVCFDLETDSLGRPYAKWNHVWSLGLSKGPGHGRAIPLMVKGVGTPTFWEDGVYEKQIRPRIANFFRRKKVYGFNAISYDSLWIEEFFGVRPQISYDAQLNAYLLDEEPPLDLESLALRYTTMNGWKSGFNTEDLQRMTEYVCQDVDATSRLRESLEPQLSEKQTKLLDTLMIPLAWTLRDMVQRGVRISRERIDELNAQIEPRIKGALQEIKRLPAVRAWEFKNNKHFNPGSPQQVADVMENYLKLKRVKETDSGNYSTDDEVLEYYREEPFCHHMMEMRGLDKIKDTYLAGLTKRLSPEDLLHTVYRMLTVTGRLCVAAGTLVEVVRDVSKAPKGIPIEDVRVGDLVYSLDKELRPTVKRVVFAGKTGHKPVIRLHWIGTGRRHKGYLDVTKDHLVRVWDGSYVKAGSLKAGDRVLAMSRDLTGDGYGRLYFSKQSKPLRDHRFLYEAVHGPLPADCHVHHKDENKLNNILDNLEAKSSSEHAREHSVERYQRRPELLEQYAEAMRARWRSGELRVLSGPENPNYRHLPKEWLEAALWAHGGKPTALRDVYGLDYECVMKKVEAYGIDWKTIRLLHKDDGTFITKEMVAQARELPNQIEAQKFIGKGYYNFRKLQEFYGFAPMFNHTIVKVENLLGSVDVYDLEVEDTNCFFANELCVHNSSSNPNLQNIPRDDEDVKAEFPIKTIFVPRPGYIFLQLDYSQLELRVLACLSGDEALLDIYRQGLDAHQATAARVYGVPIDKVTKAQRSNAKRVNFGIVYGKSIESQIAEAIEIARQQAFKEKRKLTTKEKREIERSAREFYAMHQKTFKKVWAWLRKQEQIIEEKGYQETSTGRRRRYTRTDNRAKRQGYNFPIQSLGSDVCQIALVRVAKAFKAAGIDGYPLLTVHDSIVFEVRESEMWLAADLAKAVMEGVHMPWMLIPMTVDVEAGVSWGEMVKLDLENRSFAE